MSDEKREQLIAEGRLRGDGSRIERCPTCGQELPEGLELGQFAVAQPDAVAMTATAEEV
jgi:hypothetical protein